MLSTDTSQYFASGDPTKVAGELINRGKSFFETCETNGYLASLKKNWLMYHGMEGSVGVSDQHTVRFTGEQGELVSLFVNHFRNIAQNMLVMVTSNRPVMESQSINTDYKSLAQTTLANGILEYYMRQKNLETHIRRATEMAIVMGAGYIKLEWNATDGEQYDFDDTTGQFNYTGDLNFTNLSPFDVIFDGTKETWDNEWLMTRTYKNKYSLMAQYPELAEKIRQVSTKSDRSIYKLSFFSNDKTDDVEVFEFFHKRSPALPDGRYILFLENNIVLLDTKLPYRSIPVYRIVPSEILGTPYGYTPMFDIYPIQEALNSLYSTILTNQNAFGVQNIFVPRDADMAYSALSGGMNIMEGNAPPIPINLTSTPKEIFDYLEILVKAAETISGVNSVARGAPEASLKSGTALALVQSMALQFISGLQQSYVHLIEDVGTNLIEILKDFAATPKMMTIVGKNNRPFLREFTGEDINSVSRVMVTLGNPLASSTAGRIQMVQEMTQMGLITDPKQYFDVLNTGNLDVAFEGETNQLLLIKKENEKMMEGTVPLVAPTDQHQQHINEHTAVMSDPDLREDPNLINVVMDHIEAHLNALRNTDPQLLAITKQQPLPPLQPPAPPPGTGGPGAAPLPGPIAPPAPNITPMKRSTIPGINQPQEGLVKAGEQIIGPGMQGRNTIPKVPHPPKPFQHNPVLAKDVLPQG